jgi:ParB family chromosome partitioning protein
MSKHSPRKSIISNFSALSAGLTEQPDDKIESGSPRPVQTPQPASRVGAGVIGATQRTLTDLREERDRLRAQLEAGGVRELDPSWVDPSPYPDRLPDDGDHEFEAFKKLISDEGQKVPIGVRPHPDAAGRYQVVYGHRRWRAAKELGVTVKAVIASLTDRELVIAQGIENSARQDLSWIEKALFAWRMDEAGIKARDIRSALAIDDPELARFRAVCRALTVDMILAIGRAPRAGRPRWVALGSAVSADPTALERLKESLASAKDSTSDDRFRAALESVKKRTESARKGVDLSSPSGKVVGRATFSASEIRLTIEKSRSEAFATFLSAELPSLMSKFFASEREE